MSDERYSRQVRFAPIGAAGQAQLAAARVAVIGCGALGTAIAEQLCRAGVGCLRLIDRDFVEWSNLQRQSLFSEDDARRSAPKAVAAAERLHAINSTCVIESLVEDLRAANAERLLAGVDVVLDGCDNFPTRHLVNEVCCKQATPWIYGACVGSYGLSVAIIPGQTPCLRCLQDELPGAGETPTCDTAGIIPPAVQMVAAWQIAEALKLLTGHHAAVRRELWASDLWRGTFQRLRLDGWRQPGCTVCGAAPTYPLLSAGDEAAVVLCGRDAVQIRRGAVDLRALASRLGPALVLANDYLVRWQDGATTATCFRDGRVIVQGVSEVAAARTMCDRWLG
ncbi:MAG TPA: ThiF family adenylyltransferase [Planctomycetota bacterium]|nr:ThiF family adenylyltransferase [Planctomycetota bacterium]